MSISQRKNYTAEWRMSDESVIVLDDLLSAAQPRSVLELGPGWSSWFLYDHALENNGLVYTVDHEGEHAEKHRAALANVYSLTHHFIVPLGRRKFYDVSKLDDVAQHQFDIIVLDGPVEGRSSPEALDFYASVGRENTIWVIDDTHRPEERAIVGAIAEAKRHVVLEVYDSRFPRTTTFVIPKRPEWTNL